MPAIGLPPSTTFGVATPKLPVGLSINSERTLPNLLPTSGWPSPVDDRENRLFTLVDVLEYRPKSGGGQATDDYRWSSMILAVVKSAPFQLRKPQS